MSDSGTSAKNDIQKGVDEALRDFMRSMQPHTEGETPEFMTSGEIVNLIQEHTGMYLDVSELFLKLKGAGYTYKLVGERFCWVLKRVDD